MHFIACLSQDFFVSENNVTDEKKKTLNKFTTLSMQYMHSWTF